MHTGPSVLLYAFPPLALIPPTRQSDGARPQCDFGGFALASNALAGGDLPTVVCPSIAAPAAPAPAVTRGGVDVPLPPRASGAMGLAPDWFILSAVGFLQRVTIQKLQASPCFQTATVGSGCGFGGTEGFSF